MEFYTVSKEPRPVRLSEETRRFACDSLNRRYGRMTLETDSVTMDDAEGFESLSAYEQYDLVIDRIARIAPLRFCENERVSGAAALGMALRHEVPATFHGEALFSSVSHLTPGFGGVLRYGLDAYERRIQKRLEDEMLSGKQVMILQSMLHTVDSFRLWHGRYLEACTDETIRRNLLSVPFGPAKNFHEAVQSLWMTFAFLRLCGNWPGIGRIDVMLGGYLRKDLADGRLTLEEAREILAHFFIKGCEWITGEWFNGSGDAQHYQNIVLSGVDADGNDVTNEVTYLVLDIVEELGISDFPIAVRMGKKPDPLLSGRVADVMKHGGGVVAVYNDELIINSQMDFGYSPEEARCYANDGCWEVQVPGKTCFRYHPFDSLEILQKDTLKLASGEKLICQSFEELYTAFRADLQAAVNTIQDAIETDPYPDAETPCSVISLLTEGCIEKACSYLGGGASYTVRSPHIGGVPDAANGLYAIQKIVFEEKTHSLNDFLGILRNNWEGHERLRQSALNRYTYYGNDNDEVDALAARILHDFSSMVLERKNLSGVLCPPGVSTFGRQIEWARNRTASPHGRKKGEVLSGNLSPTPATDTEGATAVIKSHCKADLRGLPCGVALDMKLLPSAADGNSGRAALMSLIDGFCKLGGFFMHIDVVDNQILKRAQEDPEAYATLAVRVSGWSARFVTLDTDWQNMIIERSEQKMK